MPNFYGLNYEKLIAQPETELAKLISFLGLEYNSDIIEKGIKNKYRTMGDQTGIHNYVKVSTQPGQKWKSQMHNSFRKSWCKKYLHTIGTDDLSLMGYNQNDLLEELDGIPFSLKGISNDYFAYAKGKVKNQLQKRIWE